MTPKITTSTHHPDPTDPCPISPCLTNEEVVSFLERFPSETDCRVSAHIASCQSCQEFVDTVDSILVKKGEILDAPDEELIAKILAKLPGRQIH